MQPVRGQLALYRLSENSTANWSDSPFINEGSRYLVPRSDGHVLAGATIEEVGFDCHTTEDEVADLRALGPRALRMIWGPITTSGLGLDYDRGRTTDFRTWADWQISTTPSSRRDTSKRACKPQRARPSDRRFGRAQNARDRSNAVFSESSRPRD